MSYAYRKYVLLMILLTGAYSLMAQDIHFTHFRMAPVSVNPANTGAFKGTYRLSGIYRDQWRAVSDSKPYQTPFASAEYNVKAGLLLKNDWVAGGLTFLNDKSGTNGFKNNLRAMNVGYHLGLDKEYKNVVSLGVSYGSITRGFNVNDLVLPGELAGEPREIIGTPTPEGDIERSVSDITIGLAYKSEINKSGDLIRIGLTGAHITNPKSSLVRSDSLNTNETRIGRRFTLTGEGSFKSGDKMRINPALLLQAKDGSTELAIQTTADYLLSAESQTVLTGGLGYRVGDAVELIGGVQLRSLRIALSYDLTTSGFRRAGGNAFEIAVGYVGNIYKKPNVKPVIFCPQL